MAKIPFSEYGRVFIPINIKPIDDITLHKTVFKVDTGADTTTISKKDLQKLGYGMDWIKQNAIVYEDKDKPTTAAGEKINAGYIQIPLINILGYEGKNWVFQIIMDEKQDFRNLLGRDLLTGFNYNFDNDEDIFTISKTKIFKPRYKFLPKQEINEIAAP
jgi:hypothetical protein